jgi:hypothetical protein
MKIIILKYNRTASAICTSTLMSDETYACKDMYKLAPRPVTREYEPHAQPQKNNQEYAISGTWQ